MPALTLILSEIGGRRAFLLGLTQCAGLRFGRSWRVIPTGASPYYTLIRPAGSCRNKNRVGGCRRCGLVNLFFLNSLGGSPERPGGLGRRAWEVAGRGALEKHCGALLLAAAKFGLPQFSGRLFTRGRLPLCPRRCAT